MDQPTFQNERIEPDWLPKMEEVMFTPLPKSYRTVILMIISIFLIILFIGILVLYYFVDVHVDISILWPLIAWVVFSGFLIMRLFLTFPLKGYAIRQKDIIYKKGLVWRSVTTIPFNRVQHCDIKQGLIERQFGLSSLNIYTAGGQNSDLTIPGLLFEKAENYKAFILKTISSDEEE